MAPAHLRRMLGLYGEDLDRKTYLFADPFSQPRSFHPGEYKVYDPSFDPRPIGELAHAYRWMRDGSSRSGWRYGAQAVLWLQRLSISR